MGVRIASTMTISSGLSRAPARVLAEGEGFAAATCEPILSIRRDAAIDQPQLKTAV